MSATLARETIEAGLREFVVEELLSGDPRDLTLDTQLLALGIIDSFTIVALVGYVERTFGVRIPDSHMKAANFGTLRGVLEMVVNLS